MVIKDMVVKMKQSGVNGDFVDRIAKGAAEFEGIRNLMEMWCEEDDALERNEILKDLNDLLKDASL